MTAAIYAETYTTIADFAEEEAERVARRDRIRRLLEWSGLLLEGAERANRDSSPKVGWRLRRQIRQLEYAGGRLSVQPAGCTAGLAGAWLRPHEPQGGPRWLSWTSRR